MIKAALSLLLTLFVSALAATSNACDRRIVALGDLHGDLPNTLAILKFANIIDEDHHWIGGDAIFVQTVSKKENQIATGCHTDISFLFRATLWIVDWILSDFMN